MPWVKIDDALGDDPRIATAGPAAVGALILALCYCNRNLTDGWITSAILQRLAGSRDEADDEAIAVLLRSGILRQLDRDGLPGYQIHDDYVRHQPSRAEVLRKRTERNLQKADAGRLGGLASGKARRKQNRSTPEAHHQAESKQNEAPIPNPIPTKDKSTGANAPASRVLERATYGQTYAAVKEVWKRYDNSTDRKDAAHKLLISRDMKAENDVMDHAERAVDHEMSEERQVAAR